MLRVNVDHESPGLRRLIEALTGDALRDLLRNLRHHSEMQRRIAAGHLDAQQVNGAYLQHARSEGGDFRRDVTAATVRYYRRLSELSLRYSERFYEHVLADAAEAGEPGDDRATEPRGIPLELHGPPRREVVGHFTVENTENIQTSTRFRIGNCVGPDGVPFTPPLTIQPSELTLPPGEQATVTLRLALLPSLFEPGFVYRCAVTAEGRADLALDLALWADEEPTSPPSDPTAASHEERNNTSPVVPHQWLTRCPDCGRAFERTQPSARLYPHKSPDDQPCPQREGVAERG